MKNFKILVSISLIMTVISLNVLANPITSSGYIIAGKTINNVVSQEVTPEAISQLEIESSKVATPIVLSQIEQNYINAVADPIIQNNSLNRLKVLIDKATKKESKITSITKVKENQYLLTIDSPTYANGSWIIDIYPPYDKEYEKADKGGFWFGLYDLNNNRFGTAKAKKQ